MRSITRIILPSLGPVCPECFSRGYIPDVPLRVPEAYSFGLTGPPSQLEWDIEAARALVAARPRVPIRLDEDWIREWLAHRTAVTLEHLDHLPPDRVNEPGLLVEIVNCPPGGEPEPFQVLIDGSHRTARRLRDNCDSWAYLLTEEEQRSVCTYRCEGSLVEIPTLPGPGVSEHQARIIGPSSGGTSRA
jgi:hypothetical protein